MTAIYRYGWHATSPQPGCRACRACLQLKHRNADLLVLAVRRAISLLPAGTRSSADGAICACLSTVVATNIVLANKVMKHYSTRSFDPSRSIGFLVKRCASLLAMIGETAFESERVTPAGFMALLSLRERSPMSPSELSTRTGYDLGGLTRVIDVLEGGPSSSVIVAEPTGGPCRSPSPHRAFGRPSGR